MVRSCPGTGIPANVHDQTFSPLVEPYEGRSIVLGDVGLDCASGSLANLKLCPRGTWNERMPTETILSMVTTVCHLRKMLHRVCSYVEMHFAYIIDTENDRHESSAR